MTRLERIAATLGLGSRNPGCSAGPGTWSAAGDAFASLDPTTGEPLAGIGPCSDDDYERVLQTGYDAWRAWRRWPAPRRGELVRRIAERLRLNKDVLGSLVALETGKIKQEGDGEVQEMLDIADFAVGLARSLGGHTLQSERPAHRLYEQWHPLGPVGVITAFNFPVAVWSWNAFIAAVCGDTVVWKPSPKAPLCAIAVQRLCEEVIAEMDAPPVFTLLTEADSTLARRMVEDARLPLVSFTGSTPVGRQVARQVALRFGRSLLELSGNNAVIVADDADLELAVPAVLFGAVGTAGQRCTSTRRLIVQEAIYGELVGRLVHAYRQVRIGDPLDSGTLMGPLIDAAAVDGFRATLDEVLELGGELLAGGEVVDGPGFFVQPTLVTAQNHWAPVQRETFAPILYLMSYHDLDEAIALNNQAAHGLSSSLFSNDLRRVEHYLSELGSDCGIANVNVGTSGAEIGGAFGGEKATGGGREAGSDAWKAYMRRQTNTINWGRDLPLAQGIRFDTGDAV